MTKRRLSERQIDRIRAIQTRRQQRFTADSDLEPELTASGAPEAGRVMVRYGANLAVETSAGQLVHCLVRSNVGQPVCGDEVIWQRIADGQGVVTALQPRRTELSRPDFNNQPKALAANLTQLVILLAPEPEPSGYLIDQYLVAAERIGVEALIVGNKMDVLTDPAAFQQRFAHYPALGYRTFWTSVHAVASLAALRTALADQVSVLVGQSGVGKSSLIKTLLPDREIQIGRLSQATGLGRHTTSATTCYQLAGGGALIDSPGVRSFRLGTLARSELQAGFRDFRPYLGQCRFADCRHDQEPDCAIRAAVATGAIAAVRLDNFHHLLRTI